MLPINTPAILTHITGEADTWSVLNRGGNYSIAGWTSATPQPTEAEIIAHGATQAFLDWEAEHGGDPTLTARRIAKEAVATPAGKLVVALVSAMRKQGVITGTKAQIINAILAEIDLGEAD